MYYSVIIVYVLREYCCEYYVGNVCSLRD